MTRQTLLVTFVVCLCAGSALAQTRPSSAAVRLCSRIAEIKELPLKSDFAGDPVYQAIVGAGESIVPCLIRQVTKTTRMRDPRCPPISNRTTVGDVTYFVLTDITKLDFIELLPPDVQQKYQNDGASAYQSYVRRKGARRQLQSRLMAWYRQKHPSP